MSPKRCRDIHQCIQENRDTRPGRRSLILGGVIPHLVAASTGVHPCLAMTSVICSMRPERARQFAACSGVSTNASHTLLMLWPSDPSRPRFSSAYCFFPTSRYGAGRATSSMMESQMHCHWASAERLASRFLHLWGCGTRRIHVGSTSAGR